jgi:transcriptional regulator with XRE-family HTH domain
MNSHQKSDFAVMCRDLRIRKGLKQREVAEHLGVRPSTYGNVESSPHKVIRREKAIRLAELYRLPPTGAAELLAAWDRCPLSAYSVRQRAHWEKRNLHRSKAKMHDRLQIALCELLGVHIAAVPDEQVCVCVQDFVEDSVCEVCTALELLGLDRFAGSRAATTGQLAALQDKLEAARAAAQKPAASS